VGDYGGVRKSRFALRRRYLEARLLPHPEPDSQAGHGEELPGLDEFWEVVRALPKRQAQVVALLYVEELSSVEVSEVITRIGTSSRQPSSVATSVCPGD
jgi:DNA-directed RNA polymerase specialized sigma24 family protein